MHSISSKYRKPKGRPSKRRAACIRNLEKGKSACSSSSDSKCDEISTGAVPSTSGHQHISSYTLRNSPMDQNTEFLTYSAKGIVNLDKTPSGPHDSLKTPDSSLKRRKK
ncbi:hypothetical protein TNCT_49891 [Trichonephila clavata]|uniref:Uncharacterized protein n=2 Tax=Trichonephila clavata TaxID=2740835 RepID=A0A8X6IW80_TRICU|nr:hypothetical protein TNCT_49891 [Trichonephila clavata]